MRLKAMFALVASLAVASAARAQDDPAQETHPLRLSSGFDAMVVLQKDMMFTRKEFTLSPEFAFRRLTIAPSIKAVETSVALHGMDGLPLELDFTLPWQPVVGLRADYLAWSLGPVDFVLRGEFETPLARNTARIDSFRPRGSLAHLPVDYSDIGQRVALRQDWRLLRGTLVIRGNFRALHPWAQIGYLSLVSSISVSTDARVTALLDAAKVHPSHFYSDGASTPFYAVGLDTEFGGGYALRYGGAVIPGARTAVTFGGAVAVPLDFLAR